MMWGLGKILFWKNKKPQAWLWCRRCGRRLKDEKSIRLGMGPSCLKKSPPQETLETEGQMRMF